MAWYVERPYVVLSLMRGNGSIPVEVVYKMLSSIFRARPLEEFGSASSVGKIIRSTACLPRVSLLLGRAVGGVSASREMHSFVAYVHLHTSLQSSHMAVSQGRRQNLQILIAAHASCRWPWSLCSLCIWFHALVGTDSQLTFAVMENVAA